jgi:hypothetical protein
MSLNKKLESSVTNFKSLIIESMLFVFVIIFAIGVSSSYGFDYVIITTISSLLGMGISITIVYYFLNNKSFKPISFSKVALLLILTLPSFLIISIGFYYGLDFIINLF